MDGALDLRGTSVRSEVALILSPWNSIILNIILSSIILNSPFEYDVI